MSNVKNGDRTAVELCVLMAIGMNKCRDGAYIKPK